VGRTNESRKNERDALRVMLADSQYQWYYWLAPILAISFIFMALGLGMGYIRKVLVPKYRGKRVE
jgi:hypothetical protein